MDLEQRMGELEELKQSLEDLRRLNAEMAALKEEIKAAMEKVAKDGDGKIIDPIDQRHIDALNAKLTGLTTQTAEVASKFSGLKTEVVESILGDVNKELSVYRATGEKGYDTQAEAMARVGNPYMTGKTEIEMQEYERQQTVSRIDEAIRKNEEKLADLDKQIQEATTEGDFDKVSTLQAQRGEVATDIARGKAARDSVSTPFKSMEDNKAEYEALYALKKSLEAMRAVDGVTLETIAAVQAQMSGVEGIQQGEVPADKKQATYDDAVAKRDEAHKNVEETKKSLEFLRDLEKKYLEAVSRGDYAAVPGDPAARKEQIAKLEEDLKRYEAEEARYSRQADRVGEGLEHSEGGDSKPEKSAMEQYQEAKDAIKTLDAEKKKIEDKLKEIGDDPDKAEEKAKLEEKLAKIDEAKKKCEEKIADVKGKMTPDDLAKVEAIEKAEEEARQKAEEEARKKAEEEAAKGGKGGKPDFAANGTMDPKDYYKALSLRDRNKTKVQAWEKLHGKKAGLFTRATMFLRPGMRSLSLKYLEEGHIDPMYNADIKLLPEVAERRAQEKAEREAREARRGRGPLDPDPDARRRTDDVSREAGRGGKPAPTKPKTTGEPEK